MDEATKTRPPEDGGIEGGGDAAYWGVLPSEVRYDKRLSSTAKVMYAEITALTKKRGYCYAGNDYFCEIFGVSERTVIRMIQLLADAGVIAVTGEQTTHRRIYSGINPLAQAQRDGFCFPAEGKCRGTRLHVSDKNVTPSDKNVTPSDKNVTPNLNRNYNPEQKTIPPIAPQGAGATGRKTRKRQKAACEYEPELFERFWKLYPRGEDKAGARYAWDELRPDHELMRRMSAALKRWMNTEEWRRGVGIPYACRWLSEHRWEWELRAPVDREPTPGGRKDLVQL